ncbi:MAG TPA: hypothetical protein DDZ51_28680 [Planctomycetaceae bacterium]|nr:hypothetical protein [Planctomycetaceae bacterium]
MIELQNLEFHAAHACNLYCPQCSHYSNFHAGGIVSMEEAHANFDAWTGRLAPRRLAILGGEPTLNPSLVQIVKMAREAFPNAEGLLVTNGFFLDRHPSLPQALIDNRFRMDVSQHGRTPVYMKRFREVHYEYDPLTDKPARVWTDDTEIHYQYEPRGLLASVSSVKEFGDTLTTSDTTTYSYNAVGLISEQTLPGGYSTLTEYDVLHRPIYHEHRDPLEELLASYYYVRDAKGRITEVFNDLPRATVESAIAAETEDQLDRTEYQYDALDRILSEMHFAAEQSQPHHQVDYIWDLVGNLHEKTVTSSGDVERSQFSYNERDELVDEVFTLNDQHQWTGEFDYDLQGNMTRSERGDVTIDYVYDVRNRLASATNTQGTEVTVADYEYDHDGLMVRRSETVDQTTATEFLIRDPLSPYGYSRVLEKRTEGGVLLASFVHGHEPIAEIGENSRHLLLSDKHSGVRDIVDLSDDSVEHVAYDAFGTLLTDPPSISSEHLYRTEPFDPVSGQYYLRARHYSPHLAAFSQQDPFAGFIENPISLHRYQYADRDPVQKHDPTGLFGVSVSLGTLSIAGGHLAKAYSDFQQGDRIVGMHMANLVQYSMILNRMVSAIEEQVTIPYLSRSRMYWNGVLRPRLIANKGKLSPTLIRLRIFAGEFTNAINAAGAGIPVKMNGFPNFTGHLYRNVPRGVIFRSQVVTFIHYTGSYNGDELRTMRKIRRVTGLTNRWAPSRTVVHHHEVIGIMMLVKQDSHRVSHAGGVFYWKLATGKDYIPPFRR